MAPTPGDVLAERWTDMALAMAENGIPRDAVTVEALIFILTEMALEQEQSLSWVLLRLGMIWGAATEPIVSTERLLQWPMTKGLES